MSDKNCKGLASVQCCNFDIKKCKYRTDEYDCYNPEVIKEALEKQLARYSKPKRKPDSNGVIPLTSGELEEFSKIVGRYPLGKVMCMTAEYPRTEDEIRYEYINQEYTITNYKAILYLADKFELLRKPEQLGGE